MANRPIKAKIDLTKLQDDLLFNANSGAVYLDLVIWPNKNGRGKHGDTHYIVQDANKAAREAGKKGNILGNLTMPEDGEAEQPARRATNPPTGRAAGPPRTYGKPRPPADPDLDAAPDDIPFNAVDAHHPKNTRLHNPFVERPKTPDPARELLPF